MGLPDKLLAELRKILTAPTSFVKVKEDADLEKIGIAIVRYVLASELTKKKARKEDE